MLPSIAEYDARRTPRGQRKRPRSSAPTNPGHMVYFIRMGDSPVVKVGRTGNVAQRVKAHALRGLMPRCLVQLLVADREDARRLEAHILNACAARFQRKEREWFRMTDANVAEAVFNIREASPVPIVGVRGNPGAAEHDDSIFDVAREGVRYAAAEAARMTRVRRLRADAKQT